MTSELIKKQGEVALGTLNTHIVALSALLQLFHVKPSDLRKMYVESIKSSEFFSNFELKELKEKVEDQTFDTLDMLDDVNLWVQLLVPKIDDGGNFGVAVQLEFVSRLGKKAEHVRSLFDQIATYHEKRAGLAEKLSSKKSKEVRTTTVAKSVEKDKTGESQSESVTVTEVSNHPEQFDALASLDLKLFLQLKDSVREQRDFLITVQDFVNKNEKKIKDPKGIMNSLPGFIL